MASSYFIDEVYRLYNQRQRILLRTLSVRSKHIFYNGYGERKLSRKTCGLPYVRASAQFGHADVLRMDL